MSPDFASSNPMLEFPKLRKWAVIGVSEDRSKYGNKIFRDLKEAGYEVYAINPKLTEVEGSVCYPNLKALPVKPEVVNLVVPPVVGEKVVDDCIELGLDRIWFQPGSVSLTAVEKAEKAGMIVVADACIMIQKEAFV